MKTKKRFDQATGTMKTTVRERIFLSGELG